MNRFEEDVAMVAKMQQANGHMPSLCRARAACLLGIFLLGWSELFLGSSWLWPGLLAFVAAAVEFSGWRRVERVRRMMAWREGAGR